MDGQAINSDSVIALPTGQRLDLAKLNKALDVVVDLGEEPGRYALVHTHGWSAADAVEYARAAQQCCDDGIDPNELTSPGVSEQRGGELTEKSERAA